METIAMNNINELIELLQYIQKHRDPQDQYDLVLSIIVDELLTTLQQMQKENKRLDAALVKALEYLQRPGTPYVNSAIAALEQARAGKREVY